MCALERGGRFDLLAAGGGQIARLDVPTERLHASAPESRTGRDEILFIPQRSLPVA